MPLNLRCDEIKVFTDFDDGYPRQRAANDVHKIILYRYESNEQVHLLAFWYAYLEISVYIRVES